MGLFDFFKKDQKEPDVTTKDKYWALTTSEDEIIDPTWEQIEFAVQNATPEGTLFASLGYFHAGLEIELIQVTGEESFYRFEALPPESSVDSGRIFVNDGISYEEMIKLFESFYKNRKIIGFRSWPTA